jgi:cobalt-precorrin-5B (C1)-methyltransferase
VGILKNGVSTGACAQAAAKACALMLIQQKNLNTVEITLPIGEKRRFNLSGQKYSARSARCSVFKYSADRHDVTGGLEICCEIRKTKKSGLTITGGKGVGKVTKPGLAIPVGDYAINPVPRAMITRDVTALLPEADKEVVGAGLPARIRYNGQLKLPLRNHDKSGNARARHHTKGFCVTISVPRGKEIARKTYNPRLGIKGGISIIGTTGIVEPKSEAAFLSSLSVELNVAKAAGHPVIFLASGYVGEKLLKKQFGIKEDAIIKIGDNVGYMLKECVEKKIKNVVLIGHIGKLVKVAGGMFNTHSKHGDARLEIIAAHAASCGAQPRIVRQLLKLKLAEQSVEILQRNKLMAAFDKIACKVVERSREYCERKLTPACLLLTLDGEIIGSAPKNYEKSLCNRNRARVKGLSDPSR